MSDPAQKSVGVGETADAGFDPSNCYASPSELGFRLRWVRQRLKLSLRDLEAKTGISASTICRIENGQVMDTTLGAFLKLCEALETPASDLLRAGEAPWNC